jgi:hypothetical protein
MWQWPTGAWDGTEPNAAAVADQYTIATRGLDARARCHHEQRHVPPWQQLPVRSYTTQAKEASHGASPRCRCRVASWERPPSGMSAEIANDRLWPKADIHNSKTIAPILQPCILALSLSQPRSGCAPSAGHGEGMDARVEATQEQLPDGPPLYPGPLCGGESGSTGRAAGVDRDVDSFSHGQDVRSKSPSPAHGLVGQDARQAPSGVAFFLCWLLIFTPGILPSALRAGFAVRARSGRARDHARDK